MMMMVHVRQEADRYRSASIEIYCAPIHMFPNDIGVGCTLSKWFDCGIGNDIDVVLEWRHATLCLCSA